MPKSQRPQVPEAALYSDVSALTATIRADSKRQGALRKRKTSRGVAQLTRMGSDNTVESRG